MHENFDIELHDVKGAFIDVKVVSRRILDYVSAGLMSPALLDSRIEAVRRLQEEDDSGSGASGNGHPSRSAEQVPSEQVQLNKIIDQKNN